MNDYFCVHHKKLVEYVPELDLYSCESCEELKPRNEVMPMSIIQITLETMLKQLEDESVTRKRIKIN